MTRVEKLMLNRAFKGPWTKVWNGQYYNICIPWAGKRKADMYSPNMADIYPHTNVDGWTKTTANTVATMIAATPQVIAALEDMVVAFGGIQRYGHNKEQQHAFKKAIHALTVARTTDNKEDL